MSLNDTLAATLSKILNAERVSKKNVEISPLSSVLKKVLTILNKEGYIGATKENEDSRGNWYDLALLGTINKCGAIKPRFAVPCDGFEKFEKRFLPAKNFGILIVSTSKGIMTHTQAKELRVGGKLLAYCY